MNAQEFARIVAEHAGTTVEVIERDMSQSLDENFSVEAANTCYWYKDNQWEVLFNGTRVTAPGTLDEVWAVFKAQYKADQDAYDLKRYREQQEVNAANSRPK